MSAPAPLAFAVFADGPGGGNPAGVVLDAASLDAAARQLVARELGLATTAFVTGLDADGVELAFHTPRGPVAMCGHATIAAVHALERARRLPPGARRARTRDAVHPFALHGSDVELYLPAARFAPLDDEVAVRAEVTAALGVAPAELGLAAAGLAHLVVLLPTLADLAALAPDHARLRTLGHALGVDTFAVSCLERDRGALRLRDLCAPIGEDEEAASGTTAAALCAWERRAGRALHPGAAGPLLVRQGVELGRPSAIRVRPAPGRGDGWAVRGSATPL